MHGSYVVGCNVWQLQLPVSSIEKVINLCYGELFFGTPGIFKTIIGCICPASNSYGTHIFNFPISYFQITYLKVKNPVHIIVFL